jgi:thiol-disulfide isomerase/thioredoxin
MMKRFVWIPLLALAISACTRQHYQIDGLWDTEDGTPVWLIDVESKDTLAQAAVRGGRFSFEGSVREPFYAYVGNGKQRVRLILEPGVVTSDINERVSFGTPMVDAYMAFHRRFYGYSRDQRDEKVALADSMVLANRDNLVGALALEDLSYVDKERFLDLYDQVSDRNQAFSLVQSAYRSIKIQKGTDEGQLFTDYLIPGGNPDGTDVKLSDYVGRGKYILLDHWASWCGPCKAEMPYIKKTWEAFHGDRFDVVSIAVSDKRSDTEQALVQLDMPWYQILDGQRIPLEIYGINAIPHLILFAPDGTILRRGLRGEDIYKTVAELLK